MKLLQPIRVHHSLTSITWAMHWLTIPYFEKFAASLALDLSEWPLPRGGGCISVLCVCGVG